MKIPAPPYNDITIEFDSEDAPLKFDKEGQAAFLQVWPQSWPAYRHVLEELFSSYDYENLLEKNKTTVVVERLVPKKKANDGADLLLRFSFDDTGITWDILQKGNRIIHAQPAF